MSMAHNIPAQHDCPGSYFGARSGFVDKQKEGSSVKEIPLTHGCIALVDEEDFDALNVFRWCVDSNGYAVRSERRDGKSILIRMHRFLCGLQIGDKRQVDHINCLKLDNRKENLRIVCQKDNTKNVKRHRDNKSGFKGVSLHKQTGKWAAYIMAEGDHKYLGLFSTPEEAHAKYCEVALRLHGEFSNKG